MTRQNKAQSFLPGQCFQLRKCFGRVGVGQFIPIRNVNGVNMRGIFPKQNTAAHALRQGEQFLKKSFFKQNGTSSKGRRIVTDPESQTEDLPFCFFLPFQPGPVIPPGDACHGFHCLAAQKRLVSRQEHAAKKLRNLFQQRRKTQPHCIVSAGQIVQQHRNIAGAAKLRNFVRTCHHDAGRKLWSIGRRKCAA